MASEGDEVLFCYKDYRDGGQWKTAEFDGVECIGRFLRHVLPQRLRHIRRYGLMGPRVASKRLPIIRSLLAVHAPQEASRHAFCRAVALIALPILCSCCSACGLFPYSFG